MGYVNAQFAFGSTNVQPIALAMKSANVFLLQGREQGKRRIRLDAGSKTVDSQPKAALFAAGYGGDLTSAGPGAVQAAQGAYFYTPFQPVEMRTPATSKFESALHSIGVTSDPTFAEYQAYASVNALVRGLQISGPNPSHVALIQALSKVHNFDAAGLLDGHTVDFGSRTPIADGPGNCLYMVKLAGSAFELVPGADPICGATLSKSVAPASS